MISASVKSGLVITKIAGPSLGQNHNKKRPQLNKILRLVSDFGRIGGNVLLHLDVTQQLAKM
jgi:hypothetical protein